MSGGKHITPFMDAKQNETSPDKASKRKRRAFTPEEDIKISQLVSIHGPGKWDFIASFLPGRNAKQCRERWRAFLSPGMVNGPWTKDEDNLLVRLYQQYGPRWAQFTKFFRGRSDYNIKNRWRRYYSFILEHSADNTQPCDSLSLLTDYFPIQPEASMGCDINWMVDDSLASIYDVTL